MFNKVHTYIVQNAASILRSPVHFIPGVVQRRLILDVLSRVFKESLEDGDFEFLKHKWLKIEIKDLNIAWLVSYEHNRLIVSVPDHSDAPVADACFRGNLNDFILIAGRKEDPDTLFFQRRLVIEGDTEFGLEVKNLIDSLDLDTLPTVLKSLLGQLSDFVYKGVRTDSHHSKGTQHVSTHRSTSGHITN